jgi:glycosyltransferase involved in cell wall biosynthesis
MHILFIPSWYPLTPDDLKGKFSREQAIAMARAGHQVGVLSFHGHTQRRLNSLSLWSGLLRPSVDKGVQTWRVHHVSGIPGYGRIVLPILANHYYKKYSQLHGRPDIIHVQVALDGGLLAMKLSRLHGINYVVTEHSTAFTSQLISAKSLAKAKKVFENAKEVLAVSSPLADCIIKLCGLSKDIKIVPNMLNEVFLINQKLPYQHHNDQFTFLNVAGLSTKKGQDVLIRAFTREFRDKPAQLLIGGDGEKYESLNRLIIELEMNEQIYLLGKLSMEQVFQYMMQCDAFVLSSLFETFGVVLIEALACGKPVIATACCGPEDVVTPDNGILVEKDSVDALGTAMKKMYNTIDQYNPHEIREHCISKFGEKAVISSLVEIYKSVLSI